MSALIYKVWGEFSAGYGKRFNQKVGSIFRSNFVAFVKKLINMTYFIYTFFVANSLINYFDEAFILILGLLCIMFNVSQLSNNDKIKYNLQNIMTCLEFFLSVQKKKTTNRYLIGLS